MGATALAEPVFIHQGEQWELVWEMLENENGESDEKDCKGEGLHLAGTCLQEGLLPEFLSRDELRCLLGHKWRRECEVLKEPEMDKAVTIAFPEEILKPGIRAEGIGDQKI